MFDQHDAMDRMGIQGQEMSPEDAFNKRQGDGAKLHVGPCCGSCRRSIVQTEFWAEPTVESNQVPT